MRKFVLGLVAFAFMAIVATITPQVVQAWGEAEYTGNGQPQFNTYTNVPGFGNEKDWVRVGKNGALTSTFNNNFEACEGEARVALYIHNGAPEGFNGENNNGTGVAKDTKLSISVPKTSKNAISAVISASNAPSVSDTASITCNGQEVELEYVANSAAIFSQKRGEGKLSNSVVNNGGVLIGTYGDDGIIPGCWDYRVYVSVVVKIKKVEKPQPIIKCVSISPISIGDNRYRFKLLGYAQNATIKGYTFDFGDGKKQEIVSGDKEVTSEEHTFTKNSKVQGSIKFDVDGQTKTENGSQCAVEIKLGEKPVPPTPVTPEVKPAVTVLPNTGPAEMLAGASGISALGYSVRRWIESRRG